MLAGWELVIGLAALVLGSFVFSAVGFGMALAMAPILLLILEPREVVVLANAMIVLATLMILAQTWRHFRWRQSWLFIFGEPAAGPSGSGPAQYRRASHAAHGHSHIDPFDRGVGPAQRADYGGPLALGSGGVRVHNDPADDTLSIGGPLAGIYAIEQDWPREQMRATLAVYFLLAGALGLVLYAATGLIPGEMVYNMGAGAPAVVAGSLAGGWLARRMSLKVFRYAVLSVIIGGCIALLGREALRFL